MWSKPFRRASKRLFELLKHERCCLQWPSYIASYKLHLFFVIVFYMLSCIYALGMTFLCALSVKNPKYCKTIKFPVVRIIMDFVGPLNHEFTNDYLYIFNPKSVISECHLYFLNQAWYLNCISTIVLFYVTSSY